MKRPIGKNKKLTTSAQRFELWWQRQVRAGIGFDPDEREFVKAIAKAAWDAGHKAARIRQLGKHGFDASTRRSGK